MDQTNSTKAISFGTRFGLALRLLFNGDFADQVMAGLKSLETKSAAPAPAPVAAPTLPPERVHASSLLLLSSLQREGRLLDFLEQEVAGFSDEDVGAAARVIHTGCRKVLRQYFEFEPATKEAEGASMNVPAGFNAQRIRLTGNVAGQPPFRGTLKHHGWIAREVRMPAVSEALDPRIVAPAEVELA
jgi:hypothetical protein